MPDDDAVVENPNRDRFGIVERLLFESQWAPMAPVAVISVTVPLAIYTSVEGPIMGTMPVTGEPVIPTVLAFVAVLWAIAIGVTGGLPRGTGGGR